jgi:methyl-accepting chemotaxis protein
LKTIAAQTENLYQHPYAVSNAARNISINLVSMHRYMKDVALAENVLKIRNATTLVDEHEQLVLRNFDLIFDRYLGNRSDIQSAYKAFIDWKVIRDEVIFLMMRGKNKEAADITRNIGAKEHRC